MSLWCLFGFHQWRWGYTGPGGTPSFQARRSCSDCGKTYPT